MWCCCLASGHFGVESRPWMLRWRASRVPLPTDVTTSCSSAGRTFPCGRSRGFSNSSRSAPERSYLSFFPLPDPRWQYDGRLRTECYSYTVFGRRETCVPPGFSVRFSAKGRLLNSVLRLRSAFKPPRTFPSCARAFGGSSWWNLSRAAAEYVLHFVEQHPDYRAYHEHSLCPDEIFFQSILLGTEYADSHEIVNDELRYLEWVEGASHPRDLSVADVPGMLESGKPFARKITGASVVAVRDAIDAARAAAMGEE